ncbi:MAG: hypothetical protein JWN36_2101 [Microbacteriaceae bacterium]|nr:hypothetical protein [Microbacteriaceae bacterium]
MNARTARRLNFRTRLGLIITGVFIAAGAGLLFAQYLVVVQLFQTAMRVTTVSCLGHQPQVQLGFPSETPPATGCTVQVGEGSGAPIGPGPVVGAEAAVVQQTQFLSDEVTRGLLIWSIVLLVVFAAIAAAIAFWLSRRSLDRIGEVTAAARDISERHLDRRLDLPGPNDEIKELGDTIDGMLDRLQLAFAAQDRFVANASHELRTPLTTTRAALEIPLKQGAVPRELLPAVRRALRATEQSERLIAALLALARGRARTEEAEVVDLAPLAAAELDELADAARARHITVDSTLATVIVAGHPALLERAVRNLLDNAIRHNIDGGRLWLRVRAEDDGAVIEVENTGSPLTAETVALLTEPFYRGDATRTSTGDGVGLGLAIAESVAITHGGHLALSPREGGGLVATLSLPAPAS